MIIVTGASGFLGQNLVRELIKRGYNLIGIIYRTDESALFKHGNLEYKRIDIGSRTGVEALDKSDIDCVFHTASIINFGNDIKALDACLSVNVYGTASLLEYCKLRGIKRFIYSSSVSVYDRRDPFPIKETDRTYPDDYYGMSKLAGEIICKKYQEYGIKVPILRYAGIYGYKARPDFVLSIFIDNVINNKNLIIYGSGKQVRDYVYVKDVVEANIAAYELGKAGIFNIASGEGLPLLSMAQIIRDIFDEYKGNIVFADRDEENAASSDTITYDISKARSKLNFSPRPFTDCLEEIRDLWHEDINKR